MRRVYQNPPLIEALCEFQFVSEQPWDWTVPGRLFERIQHEFPIRREQNVLEVELHATGTEVRQNVKGGVARMLFLRKDESALIQVGPDILVVNCLRPYPHWENFRTMIHQAISDYSEVAQPSQIRRIGLRYINRIEVPLLSEAEMYVRYIPRTPEKICPPPSSWIQHIEFAYDDDGLLRVQSGTLVETGTGQSAVLLDIEFATQKLLGVHSEDWLRWLENAHTEIERVFEAHITDRARQLFGVEEINE